MSFYLAQAIGFIVLIIRVIGIQFAQKKHILFSLILVNFLFIAHYLLIGSWLSVIVCLMGAIQTVAVYFFEKKQPKLMFGVVISCAILAASIGLFNFADLKDLLPLFSVFLSTTALLMKKEQFVRVFLGLNSTCWLIFDLLIAAYAMSAADALFIASTLIAIIRYSPSFQAKTQRSKSN